MYPGKSLGRRYIIYAGTGFTTDLFPLFVLHPRPTANSGNVLGCDECVKSWYASDPLGRNCPACKVDRGYVEMMLLHGLDDLLAGIKNLDPGDPFFNEVAIGTCMFRLVSVPDPCFFDRAARDAKN